MDLELSRQLERSFRYITCMRHSPNPIPYLVVLLLLLASCGTDSPSQPGDTQQPSYSRESVIGNWQSTAPILGYIDLKPSFATDGSYTLLGNAGDTLQATVLGTWNFVPPSSVHMLATSCGSEPANLLVDLVICSNLIDASTQTGRPDTLDFALDTAGTWTTEWLGNPISLTRIP